MRELPEGNDLLSIARKVLLNNLMPLLPVERRYDVLMVANAMGIAMRQMSMGNEIAKQNRQVLEGLIANEGVTDYHDYETASAYIMGVVNAMTHSRTIYTKIIL